MAVAFGPTSCSSVLVPKSKLLHSPEAQYGFVPKHSRHGGKNLALQAEKPILARLRFSERRVELAPTIPSVSRLDRRSTFLVEHSVTVFFPLKMSYVVKQCVEMLWLVRELAHRHKAMTSTQKLGELRHRKRGF